MQHLIIFMHEKTDYTSLSLTCLHEESSDIFILIQDNSNVKPVVENGHSFPETKTVSSENGSLVETHVKDVVSEGFNSVAVYDQWVAPQISGPRPKARYEV